MSNQTLVFLYKHAPASQMYFKPGDPTAPWRADVAGSRNVLIGSKMTYLPTSHFWMSEATEAVKDKVHSLCAGRDEVLHSTLGTEVYISLFSRLTTPGQTVLAPWDPTGVIQAASIAVGNPSITFLGLTRRTTIDSDGVPDLPILGFPNTNSYSVRYRIGDHHGNVRPAAAKDVDQSQNGDESERDQKRQKTYSKA